MFPDHIFIRHDGAIFLVGGGGSSGQIDITGCRGC